MKEKKDSNSIRNFLIENDKKKRKDNTMIALPFLKLNLLNKGFLDIETEKKEQLINSETSRLMKNNNEESSFLSEIRLRLSKQKEFEKKRNNIKKYTYRKIKSKKKFKSNSSFYRNSSLINNKNLNKSEIKIENLKKSLSVINIKNPFQFFITKINNTKKDNSSKIENLNFEKIEEIYKKKTKENFNIENGINKLMVKNNEKINANTFSKLYNRKLKKKLIKTILKNSNEEEDSFSELNNLEKEENTNNKNLRYVKDNKSGKFILMKKGKADLINFGDAYSKMEDTLFYNNRKPILSKYPEIRLKANLKSYCHQYYCNVHQKIDRNTNKIISLFYKNNRLFNSVQSHLRFVGKKNLFNSV